MRRERNIPRKMRRERRIPRRKKEAFCVRNKARVYHDK